MLNHFKAYFHSPIGIIEITSDGEAIESVIFVERAGKNKEPFPLVISQCINELDEYFAGKRKSFSVMVNPLGTKFQKKVWKELQKIPYGKTNTYSEIAKKVSHVKSTRAVGGANGKNKIAIIIPCHRVIGKNNSLVGYAGGIQRKQWLLEHEASMNSGQTELFKA